VIDTPGMRELQLWENDEGVERAFEDIAALAQGCKFRDCSHHGERECAIEEAVNRGSLSLERLESYRKLLAELRFQERKMNPEAARQEKAKWKKVHKAMRHQSEEF
jgi:ribosome biogenesis GTPase